MRWKRWRVLGLGAFLLAYAALLWFVGVPCPFATWTGIYCPGCGATRALKALVRGDLVLALHQNAWLMLLAGPALLASGYAYMRPVSERGKRRIDVLLHVAGWSGVAFFVLRNVPFGPFLHLAPM